MYLGVDVGGTKTLVAVLSDQGEIVEHDRFPTPKKFNEWLQQLDRTLTNFLHHDFHAAGVGMPGPGLDRKKGVGLYFSNMPWRNVPMLADVEKMAGCPAVVENDAKMAALSEALLLKEEFDTVLYVTVSTGIGFALVANGVVDTSVGDGGGRTVLLEYHGKMTPWEDFASGKAIVERFGKKAEDLTDKTAWQTIAHDLSRGLIQLIAIVQPQVIVFGGSVGAYFDKYDKLLEKELKQYDLPLITLPKLRQAQRPEEAVVFGCYDLAKQVFGHA